MANFSIIQPLAETVDRTGQSFETGRAGANTSVLGSAIEGYTRTRGNIAKIDALEQQTAATYNPDKLAADQVRRDLQNEILDEALEKSRIDNEILDATGLEKAEETINESRSRQRQQRSIAAKNAEAVRISKATGVESARSASAERFSNAANMSAQARNRDMDTLLDGIYGGKTRESEAIAKAGAGFQAMSKAVGSNGSGGGRLSTDPLADTAVPGRPGDTAPQSAIEKAVNNFLSADDAGQELQKHGKLELETSRKILANNTKRTENAVTRKSADYLVEAKQAAADRTSGNGNALAGIEPLTKLSSLLDTTKDLDQKGYLGQVLAEAISAYGGPDEYLEQLETEISDPEALKTAKASVYKALARTGNRELLPSEQKSIYDSFAPTLGPEGAAKFVADPESVYADLDKMISNRSNEIKDPDFKRALRTSEYMLAARKASKDGTQPFTVTTDRIESGGTGSDIVGQDSASQIVMKFTGADGSTGVAPLPGNNPEDEHVLNMLDEVSSRSSQKGAAKQQARQATQQIQDRNATTASPGQAPTPVTDVTPTEQAATAQGADVVTPANVAEADVVEAPQSAQDANTVSLATLRSNTILTNPTELVDRIQDGSPGMSDKDAGAMAKADIAEFNKHAKVVRERIQETAANVDVLGQRAGIFSRVIDLVDKNPELEDYLGPGGRFKRGFAEVLSKLPGGLNDSETNQLLELSEQAQGSGVLDLVSKGLAARIMDTEAEKKALVAFIGSLDRGITGMRELSKFTTSTHGAVRSINKLESDLVGLKVRPAAATRIVEAYRQKHSQKDILTEDGKLVPNPNYLSLDDFNKQHNLLRSLRAADRRATGSAFDLTPPDSGGEAAAPLTKPASVGGTEDTEDTTVLPPIKDDPEPPAAPVSFSGEPSTAGTSNEETVTNVAAASGVGASAEAQQDIKSDLDNFDKMELEAPERNKSVIKFAKEMFTDAVQFALRSPGENVGAAINPLVKSVSKNVEGGRLDRQAKIFKERAAQDPELRAALDLAKKELNSKEYNSAIGKVMTATSLTDLTLKDAALTVDATIESASGGLLSTAQDYASDIIAKVTGESPNFDKLLRKEVREDFQLQNPGLSVMADIIAFGSVASASKKLGTAGLKAVAKKSPASKKAVQFLSGETVGTSTGARAVQKIGQVASQAAIDAGTNVVISKEGTVGEQAAVGAVAGVAGQAIAKVGSFFGGGAKNIAIDLFGQPDAPKILARLLTKTGTIGKTITDKIAKAEAMAGGKFEVNLHGLLNANERAVLENVLATKAGHTAIQEAAKRAATTAKTNISEATRLAKLDKVSKSGDVIKDVRTVVESNVDDALKEVADKQAGITRKQLTSVLDSTETGIQANVQKELNRINGVAKRSAPNVKSEMTPLAKDASVLEAVENRIGNLETVNTLISKSLHGVKGKGSAFNAVEEQWSKNFGKKAIEDLYANLAGTKGVGKDRFDSLIRFVNDSVRGAANAAPTEEIPKNAINVIPLGSSFKHLAELRQIAKRAKFGSTEIGKAVADRMTDTVDNAIAKAFKAAGESPSSFKKLIDSYGNLSEAQKIVASQLKVFSAIDHKLRSGTLEKLRKDAAIFGSVNARKSMSDTFGKRTAAQLDRKLTNYDEAVDIFNKATTGSRVAKAEAVGLGAKLESALSLVGQSGPVGENLIRIGSGDSSFIPNVVSGMGRNGKELARRSVLSDIASRAKAFGDTKAGYVIPEKAFKPREVLGYSSQEWGAVQQVLTKGQKSVLDTYFDRTVAVNSTEALSNLGIRHDSSQFSAWMQTIFRRAQETQGLSLVDVVTGRAFLRLSDRQQQALAKAFTHPDPKKVNAVWKQAVDLMETRTTLAGRDVVLKRTPEEAKNAARILLVGAWTSSVDNAAERSSIRADRREALKALQKIK